MVLTTQTSQEQLVMVELALWPLILHLQPSIAFWNNFWEQLGQNQTHT